MVGKHLAAALLSLCLAASCVSERPDGAESLTVSSLDSGGALVGVTMTSQVGVLLDEVPASMRARVAAALVAKPASFWKERAKIQARLATYRLIFREFFYGGSKKQLPFPPENVWDITLLGTPKRVIDSKLGHDTVVVGYRLDSVLVTDAESPAISEPKLGKVGGTWDEPFVFPIDPELLFQRTGYACMDEEDFPYDSVDSEEVDTFYDQDCTVEKELSAQACHQTELPSQSCQAALDDHVGKVSTVATFTRLPWDPAVADAVRVFEPTTTGADLEVYLEDFLVNRVEYRYFEPDSCELLEQCIGAPGWRRLLQFNSSDQNRGATTLDIGAVDYYLTGDVTLNDQYNIFELSMCHAHYHFTHYGSFSWDHPDALVTHKQGFCLQSTYRAANSEQSPLHNPYGGCDYQGVAAGWLDQYKIGLPCQWVDVTDVDTSAGPVTAPLTFISNPDGILCEGTPVLDADGNPVFEPTEFTNDDGETVWRPKCEFSEGWDENNAHTYDATVPAKGETYVNQPCTRGQLGPLRNCGWSKAKDKIPCTPGAPVTLQLKVPKGAPPQVARVCDRSAVLDTGIACIERYAIASVAVEGTLNLSVTCPAARSASEPGGAVSVWSGPVFPDDAPAAVNVKKL